MPEDPSRDSGHRDVDPTVTGGGDPADEAAPRASTRAGSWLIGGVVLALAATVITFWIVLLSSDPTQLWLTRPAGDAGEERAAGRSPSGHTVTIRDAVSATPISRAVVTLSLAGAAGEGQSELERSSSSAGDVTFDERASAARALLVHARGYRDARLRGAPLALPREVWLHPELGPATASIEVRVLDRDGEPWAGAEVTCTSPTSPAETVDLGTDRKGVGRFEGLSPEVYVLETEPVEDAPAGFIRRAEVRARADQTRIVYLGGAPPTPVSVEISDDRPRLLGGVRVELLGSRSVSAETREDDGKAELGRLPPGFYELVLPGPTEWRFTDEIFVEPNVAENAQAVIGSQRLRGKVGRGAAFRVQSCLLGGLAHRGRTTVEESGEFEFERVPRGTLQLDLELHDLPHRLWRPLDVLVSGLEEVVELDDRLEQLGLLEVSVGATGGEPLPGAAVTCRADDEEDSTGSLRPVGAGTRQEVYGAIVPAGHWNVRVQVDERTLWEEAIDVTSGQRARRDVSIELGASPR